MFLLVTANGPDHYVIDAFLGDLMHYAYQPSGVDLSHLAPAADLLAAPIYH
jgi:COMPASS component SWD2